MIKQQCNGFTAEAAGYEAFDPPTLPPTNDETIPAAASDNEAFDPTANDEAIALAVAYEEDNHEERGWRTFLSQWPLWKLVYWLTDHHETRRLVPDAWRRNPDAADLDEVIALIVAAWRTFGRPYDRGPREPWGEYDEPWGAFFNL